MKNTMKRILCAVLVIVMLFSVIALPSTSLKTMAASDGTCGENVTWILYNGTLTISGTGAMTDYARQEDVPWYSSRRSIKKIVINYGVTNIGDNTFRYTTATSVSIPSSVTRIGDDAFFISDFISLKIPDSVKTIGESAFSNCRELKQLSIGKGVTTIGESAFTLCDSLESVLIPGNVRTIGSHAFSSCSELKTVVIEEGVRNIGICAFEQCDSLTSIIIPDSVTSPIGDWCFYSCDSLTSVVIGDNVPGIETDAFCACSKLSSIYIPLSVKYIEDLAFINCPSINNVLYQGSEADWNNIKIGSDNGNLKAAATFSYNYVKESVVPEGTLLPLGYDFYEDSYKFGNYGSFLSKKYFTGLFKSANAELLYLAHYRTGGLCAGFAYTTAAIYNNYPSVNSIYFPIFGEVFNKYASCLREVNKSDWFKIGDGAITISDYIKYAYVYQMSENVNQKRTSNEFSSEIIREHEHLYDENGISNLYELVKSVTSNNSLGVIIWLDDIVGETGCHAVLCVGVDDDSILIDDCNLRTDKGWPDELAHLRIKEDGSWIYEPYNGAFNSTNTLVSYATDYSMPYTILQTGNKVIGDAEYEGNFVFGIVKLDLGKGVLYCDATNYELNDINKTKFLDVGSGEKDVNFSGDLYWVNCDEKIEINNINNLGEKAEFKFSSGDTIAEVVVSESSSISFDSSKSLKIDAEIDNEYTVSYAYCFEDEDYKDNVVRASITGTASDTEITATQTDTGLLVTGISDGTVTLTKDDEVIATEEIEDAVGDVEITYDKDGEDEEVELDYHSHSYASEITTPATHLTEGVETFICGCGDTYTEPVAKLEGHTYTSEITKEATHLAEGVMTYTCDCGDSYTEAIGKIAEHTYEKTEIAPSCTANGIVTYTCACNDSYTETIEATGHSYADNGICTKCDNYDKAYDKNGKTDNCSCNCHKGGFMGFIWKLINFFYKLFGVNKTCSCGASHY